MLIEMHGTVQHISYILDGDEMVPDWFEPYHFDDPEEELFVSWNEVTRWVYINNEDLA